MTSLLAAFYIVLAVFEFIDSAKPNQGYNIDGSIPNKRTRARIYVMIPMVLSILAQTYQQYFGKKSYKGDYLISLLRLVLNIGIVALVATICLRLDGYSSHNWMVVFYPFWIIFILFIILTLVFAFQTIITIMPLLMFRKINVLNLAGYSWAFLNITSLTVLGMLIFLKIASTLNQALENQIDFDGSFLNSMMISTMVVSASLFVTTSLQRNYLMQSHAHTGKV